jgi:hypothetical protein
MTQPPRTRAQIVAEIEAERQQLAASLGRLRRSRCEATAKVKRTAPIVGAVVAFGGFLATKGFLGTLRYAWRRIRR